MNIEHINAPETGCTPEEADVARPKRRPYNASGSLSEYGVFPECDAQPLDTATPPPEAVVEAVARAICVACEENPDHEGDARGNDFRWQDYRDAALAAISAIDAQPAAVDEAMVKRFLEAFQNTPGDEAIGADEKVARRWLTAALSQPAEQRADPAQPDASVLVEALRNLLSDDDIRHLRRFQEICEDSDADGHDLPKEAVMRLERAGALRSCGFGRHETTRFGDAILAALSGKGGE